MSPLPSVAQLSLPTASVPLLPASLLLQSFIDLERSLGTGQCSDASAVALTAPMVLDADDDDDVAQTIRRDREAGRTREAR